MWKNFVFVCGWLSKVFQLRLNPSVWRCYFKTGPVITIRQSQKIKIKNKSCLYKFTNSKKKNNHTHQQQQKQKIGFKNNQKKNNKNVQLSSGLKNSKLLNTKKKPVTKYQIKQKFYFVVVHNFYFQYIYW